MKISKRLTLIRLIYLVLLFQIPLQFSNNNLISFVFNYIDDAIAAICMIYVVSKLIYGYKLQKFDKIILKIYSLFIVIGLLSSIISKIQVYQAIIFDFLTCMKFIFGYLATKIYFSKYTKRFIKESLNKITKVITVIFFVLSINDEFLNPIFPIFDYRYFGKSIELMYPHPTYLAASCIAMMLVLAAIDDKRNIKYLVLNSIIITFTFRAKAIAFVFVFWGIYLLRYVFKITNKLPYIFSSLTLSVFVGYDQFQVYFQSTGWSARAVMLVDAISLAKTYFPFGAGFGSFGTNMSVVFYSKLYNLFGYNSIYGMSETTAAYLNDGFWQAVIGQFGFFGFLLFVLVIVVFFVNSYKENKHSAPMRFISVISLNIYLIIASIGEMAYFAPYAITFFMILGAISAENKIINQGKSI